MLKLLFIPLCIRLLSLPTCTPNPTPFPNPTPVPINKSPVVTLPDTLLINVQPILGILDGSKSKGTYLASYWRLLNADNSVKIIAPDSLKTRVYFFNPGTYQFELTFYYKNNLKAYDTTQIVIK